MFYLLMGEDDFSLRQALGEIKKGVGDPTALATNSTVLDGSRAALEQVRAACDTVPFLAEKRLVVVEGLAGRFEPSPRANQKKARPADRKEELKAIVAYASQVPESTILVLAEGKLSARNPLLAELSAAGLAVRSFPLLKGEGLRRWLQQRVTEAGGSIAPGAADLLLRFVGSNLWILVGEVNKLVSFAAGRRIEEEDVRAVVSYAQEASVFAMVDAILEFKAGEAEKLLSQMLQQGAAPAYLLMMLTRQVRLIVRAGELKRQGKPRTEIQSRLGNLSEFVLRKALEQAAGYSLERLKEVYHRLLEADLSIKTGRYDGELALNILVAELCQRGSTRQLNRRY